MSLLNYCTNPCVAHPGGWGANLIYFDSPLPMRQPHTAETIVDIKTEC